MAGFFSPAFLLDPFDLGGSDHPAPSVLLIDRERNLAYAAPAGEAKVFLRDQFPPEPPLTEEQQAASKLEMDKMLAERRTRPVDYDSVAREMLEQRGRVGRLMSWLEQCPTPERDHTVTRTFRVSLGNSPPPASTRSV